MLTIKLEILRTELLTLQGRYRGFYRGNPLFPSMFPAEPFSPPPIIRQPLRPRGWIDYPIRRIYGHPLVPDGSFVDSLVNVHDPTTGAILGRIIGDSIVPPFDH